MTSLRDWLGFRRRDSAGDTVLLIAREVTDRQRSVQGGLAEIRDPSVLDRLSAEDFEGLDLVIEEQADEDREYAVVLARLTYAAARAKGFDDQIVDAADAAILAANWGTGMESTDVPEPSTLTGLLGVLLGALLLPRFRK